MSSASDTRSRRGSASAPQLVLDRIACTGHGICASVLPGNVMLDQWGYPIVQPGQVEPALGDAAIRLCPARALSWRRQQR
jgi:ferredoxin